MKIVYCIAGTYNSAGMERVLSNKVNYWASQGHEVLVLTTDQRGQKPYFPLDSRVKCCDLGINYEENNGKSFWDKLRKYPFKMWRHKVRMSKILKDFRADIVVSMSCNDSFILPSIHDGSKKILESHFCRYKRLQYNRRGLWRLADQWRSANDLKVAARFDRFVVLTHEDQAYWGNLPNIQVIPNARTYTFETPASLDHKVVLAVGRYDYQKGFERLIEAWKTVCQQVDDWKLAIIGDGQLRPQMEQQIKECGLTDKIILKRLPANEMKNAYLQASIFALSSRFEGLPMVLLEAQAAGLPIVSFTCKCGPKDVVEDGVNGYLVEEGDVSALADRLLRLIQDEQLRKQMGKAAYCNSTKYSDESVMKQWQLLFHELVKSKVK